MWSLPKFLKRSFPTAIGMKELKLSKDKVQLVRFLITFNAVAQFFHARLEELRTSYKLTDEQLLIAIPELLKATALLWCRNNHKTWNTWDHFLKDFRSFYLPADYTLIRRHSGMSPAQELYRVYTNLLPDYRQYIRCRDCNSFQDLVREIEAYEKLQKELKHHHATNIATVSSIKKPRTTSPPNTRYERKGTCWRCGGTQPAVYDRKDPRRTNDDPNHGRRHPYLCIDRHRLGPVLY
ncbi:hypothetical protein CBL_02975 [Carabus blaptoides fortunei]